MSLLTRDGFFNNYPVKPMVICQPLSNFDMFTFVVSHTVCSILVFLKIGGNRVFIFGGEIQKGAFLKERMTELG